MSDLVEIDQLIVQVIVDNEVDPLSPYDNTGITVSGRLRNAAADSPYLIRDGERGEAKRELRKESLCCGAHGLSLMLTAVKGDSRRTMLFDTGPEADVWESNARRLRANISTIDLIHLSHWHWDHSGGMLRAIRMITEAKAGKGTLVADLHPSRPDFRGFMIGEEPVSLEADPSFKEIEGAGATVVKSDSPHTVLDDMFLISGEIPRVTSYETGLPRGIRFNSSTKTWEKDELVIDERFVACNVRGKGLIVFTGCSHGGAVNASRCALALGKDRIPLYSVVGGLHLADADKNKVHSTVQDLKDLDVKIILGGHCTGWRAKFEIEKAMPGRLAPSTVGTTFTF